MSANERPEVRAFKELESLVRNLGEELAVFRRRAIAAETELKESGGGRGHAARGRVAPSGRAVDLEAENEVLRIRLQRAEDRVRQMMERLRFLRQQLQSQATAGAGRS